MFDLIKETQANGVIFISGDVHWAEINKRQPEGLYPIYDVTASGLTEEWHNVEPSQYRIGEAYRDNHFGMIDIVWKTSPPEIKFQIIGLDGKTNLLHSVSLNDLQFSN